MEEVKTENQLASPPPAPEKPEKIVHQLEEEKKGGGKTVFLIAAIVIVGAGIVTGYLLSRGKGLVVPGSKKLTGEAEMIVGSKEVGIKDESVFKDTAQGKLEVNDFSQVDEGSHKLIRSGGESQTAYLTSSVIALDEYTGKCVQIWGETFAAQKAGWLMDVGRLKILDKCPEGV